MSTDTPTVVQNHGGILFPLDMFRPSMLAAALAEGLVARARNVLDAKLVLTRHPEVSLVLARIEGSVVGDDEAAFWRENAELAMFASQALPRQCFMYFMAEGPEKRQGFVVAQRGQVVAGDDAGPDTFPAGTPEAEWPVNRLCAQIQIHPDELKGRFEGGPTVETSLMEPSAAEDEAAVMLLAGQPPGEEDDDLHGMAPPGAGAPADAPSGQSGAQQPTTGAGRVAADPNRPRPEDDARRRATEQAEEQRKRDAAAEQMIDGLRIISDDLGLVVVPKAELGDTDLLEPYVVRKIDGELPAGLPRDRTKELQGKRIDFATVVEFLSEVFYGNAPLTKPAWEENAEARTIGGQEVKILEAFAPRLGAGTFIRKDRAGVFISRTPALPLPESLITSLLDEQD